MPSRVLRDHERAVAGGDPRRDAAPERDGALARERVHEAHRGAAVDAVDQDVGEAGDMGLVEPRAGGEGTRGWAHRRVHACVLRTIGSDAITTA